MSGQRISSCSVLGSRSKAPASISSPDVLRPWVRAWLVLGHFKDEATYQRVAESLKGATPTVFDSGCRLPFGRSSRQRRRGPRHDARVVSRRPTAATGLRARSAVELHGYINEAQPYRIQPRPRERWGSERSWTRPLREHAARGWLESATAFESGADHDGGELRSRGPRPLHRAASAAPRDAGEPLMKSCPLSR